MTDAETALDNLIARSEQVPLAIGIPALHAQPPRTSELKLPDPQKTMAKCGRAIEDQQARLFEWKRQQAVYPG